MNFEYIRKMEVAIEKDKHSLESYQSQTMILGET